MSRTTRDAPAVLVFPPVIPLGTVIVAGVLQWLQPLGLFAPLTYGWRLALGGIVLPEESYLERKFGDQYRGYRSRVPRYLGPL